MSDDLMLTLISFRTSQGQPLQAHELSYGKEKKRERQEFFSGTWPYQVSNPVKLSEP